MTEAAAVNDKRRKKKIALLIFTAVLIAGAVVGFFYLRYARTHLSTDDAFVEGAVHVIAPKVPGTVLRVHAADNRPVRIGDLLVEIDPADYEVRLRDAAASLNVEKAKLGEVDARIDAASRMLAEMNARVEAARANLDLQAANLKQAEMDLKRAESLNTKEVISKDRYEKTKTAHEVAAAQVRAASEQLKQTQISVETQKAVLRQAESQRTTQLAGVKQKEAVRDAAEMNVGYARVTAPADGYVTRKGVEVGNQVQAGQPLMSVVPLTGVYVMANYKETQVGAIRPGQEVRIRVDAFPGKVFQGRVESIMAGTGSAFSLFPAENATGNYVKVVQRVPVKIVLEQGAGAGSLLRVGMSVEPTVLVK